MKLKIKVKRINKSIELPKIIDKGDWIDLRSSKDIVMSAPQASVLKRHKVDGVDTPHRDVKFDSKLIGLGVAMRLPKGFEAVVLPRSSSFKHWGIIQTNSMGVIDNSYSSNEDEWKLPVIATRDEVIKEGERVCQFRVQLSQKATFWQKLRWFFCNGVKLVEVQDLGDSKRGGFGSTGK